ncbi:uncharacterized protein DUF1992 [Diaminobutyricimonas aerilata]|uniref:Uncharacterized protein DUF1992 n=1 Tax=Diaminobutyricimonas aerilata TaxID=1162967 RepID=A0A2M9CNT5_9MICO|nr:DUF1992 domain-containing protein [Diaminobutyricimonas aerilata]PJJ73549.1 uncharacterized protein DUF1992 [Diaminobutyricimonas aerilata]
MVQDARRNAWRYRLDQLDREMRGDAAPEPDTDEEDASPTVPNAAQRAAYVETAIDQAIRRGEFDDLPGAGKPLTGLGGTHDPDWWIRRKIEREQLTGLGPPAVTLRVENAALEGRLDAIHHEDQVREALEDFNKRIIEARRQLQGGPPVVTPLRDVDAEVAAWRARRDARHLAHAEALRREKEAFDALSPRERRRLRREQRRAGR